MADSDYERAKSNLASQLDSKTNPNRSMMQRDINTAIGISASVPRGFTNQHEREYTGFNPDEAYSKTHRPHPDPNPEN